MKKTGRYLKLGAAIILLPVTLFLAIGLFRPAPSIDWIVLLGSDDRGQGVTNNLDTIMLARVDYAQSQLVIFSLPRDLFVELDNTSGKISAIERRVPREKRTKNYGNLRAAISIVTGITVDHYIALNMAGLREIIESTGGIDVTVSCPFSVAFPVQDGVRRFSFSEGPAHLNGEETLAFIRFRQGVGDLARIARQQRVLGALHQKVIDSPLSALRVFLRANSVISTNLSLPERLRLGTFVYRLDRERTRAFFLRNEDVREVIVPETTQKALSLRSDLFRYALERIEELSPLGERGERCELLTPDMLKGP